MKSAIRDVFRDPANTWDLPVVQAHKRPAGAFEAFMDSVVDRVNQVWKALKSAIRNFAVWLHRIFSRKEDVSRAKPQPASRTDVSIAVASFSLLLAAAVLFSLWKRRNRPGPQPVEASISATMPIDLLREDVQAIDQSEDEWITLAERYRASGEFRLALRALYLSSLAALGRAGMLSLARGKSNLDYLRELQRRSKRLGSEFVTRFQSNVHLFERSWYGTYPATEEILETFQRNFSALHASL